MPENEPIQPRLLVGAPEAVVVTAHYSYPHGWSLHVTVRRQLQAWAEASQGLYEDLDTPELLQVIEDALSAELRL